MNSTHAPLMVQLEAATRSFRARKAKKHLATVGESIRSRHALQNQAADILSKDFKPFSRWTADGEVLDEAPGDPSPDLSEEIQALLSRERWHHDRGKGQYDRFSNLRTCGARNMIARCAQPDCRKDRKAVPESCGIVRLCNRCSLVGARKRIARFGRARARVLIDADTIGFTRRGWKQWRDRMITLTAPHFALEKVEKGSALDRLGLPDTTQARVWALRLAWPAFLRRLALHWKGNPKRDRKTGLMVPETPATIAQLPRYEVNADGEKRVVLGIPPYHRAFEWTPGSDGLGHPHFHVWTFAPRLDAGIVQGMWYEALRSVGVPFENAFVKVDVREFKNLNIRAARELMKGGREGAIKLARLARRGAPKNAFQYSDGWTIYDVLETASTSVIASLYCALEGMRLSQASRAFFGPDEPAKCEHCGHFFFEIRFEPRQHVEHVHVLDLPRGPPS